jgi:hypothetical protein
MVVVVLSILIAFGVDAWWDGYRAAQEEAETMAALRTDFENSLALLENRWIPVHTATMEASFELLWIAQRGPDPFPGVDTLDLEAFSADFLLPVSGEPFGAPARTVAVRDSVLAVALFDATFDPTLSALDALLQSGSLGRIRNRALRTALARFPALLEDSNDEERRTRDLVNQRLRPALSRAGNIIAAEIVSWDFHEATLDLDRSWPAPVLRRETELIVNSEIANLLASRTRLQRDVVGSLVQVADLMRQILDLLAAELD